MLILGFIVPLFVIGAIAWFIVGLVRSKATDAFTTATATAFYGHLMLISGLMAALAGGALAVKVALAHVQLSYSYYVSDLAGGYYRGRPTGAPGPEEFVRTQLAQDTVLAATLFVVGVLVVIAHAVLVRFISRAPGAAPNWITRGSLIATTLVTAAGGIGGTISAAYLTLVFVLVPQATGQSAQPFGDSVGTAVFFLPAWIVCMVRLVGRTRTDPERMPVPVLATS